VKRTELRHIERRHIEPRRIASGTTGTRALLTALGGALAVASPALMAQGKAPASSQLVKPPVAQAWIDVATGSGMGMPAMGAGGAPDMGALMGAMMGRRGGGQQNSFGQTRVAPSGRWVDVTLFTRANPQLAEATQAVPAGTQLAPTLKLQAPPQAKSEPAPTDDREVAPEFERPKGKLMLYWGCGESVRAGQPKVLDMAKATPQELGQFFQARSSTTRGAHSAAGRPVWPSQDDRRMLPEAASLVGEHAFSGQGVPASFKFNLPAAQDLMPPIALSQRDSNGATQLSWQAIPHARAYFIGAMGAGGGARGAAARGGDEFEMVIWTSSELPETGFALFDYQTNAAVDRWVKDRVLLAPGVTQCAVPKGIFGDGGGAMLRMIAYGSELGLAHPPRPTDPKIAWEPEWSVKLRVKSQTSAMLGMDMAAMQRGEAPARDESSPTAEPKKEEKKANPVDVLRGIFGR
jgi:hypothetical protein